MDIGKKIYNRRKELGLTQEAVAIAVGVTKSTVNKWESGQTKSIRSNHLQSLAETLGVSTSFLLNQEEDTNTEIVRMLERHLKKIPKEKQKLVLEYLNNTIQTYIKVVGLEEHSEDD